MSRHIKDRFFIAVSTAAIVTCCIILLFLITVIVGNGAKAINIDFLLLVSKKFGSEGGILYQIIGSLLLVLCAALICFPVSLGTAIFKSEYLQNNFLQKLSNSLIFGLNSIPSVIFGIFGLIFFVNICNTGISWFVGSVILAIMILPTVVLSTYQAINSIPLIYRESALTLGLDKWRTITCFLLPQGIGGAVTGLFIGLARAIGETAPIMFIATAFSGIDIPSSPFDPVVALPTHILALAQQATHPKALQNAWGASMVLLSLVLIFSVLAFLSRIKLQDLHQR